MSISQELGAVLESREKEWVERLAEVVRIKSVSASPEQRPTVVKMAHWIVENLQRDWPEAKVWLTPTTPSEQNHPSGVKLPIPPLVQAEIGGDRNKKTVLIYAHYDVQPAEIGDGWDTDPWELTRMNDDELRGRGSTDDKGPLIGWMNVLRVYRDLKKELPVNIKFVFEGMEESGSEGFVSTIERMPEWFENIDFCCVSDNYWTTTHHPCLTYGCRGVTTVEVAVSGPKMDMHSGSFGGQVYEPMDDLIDILASLKKDNKIMIDGIYDDVLKITKEEQQLYDRLNIDLAEKAQDVGVSKFRDQEDKAKCIMATWRNPSLTIHGIEGAYSEPGFKTVIPRKVTGKFSIRTVPNQKGAEIESCITKHVRKVFDARGSVNKCEIRTESGDWYYVEPLNSKVFKAAAMATEQVYGVQPDYTREGGSIPIMTSLVNLTKTDLALIPMGRVDDRAHAQNEKLDLKNYIHGMKLFAAFLESLPLV